MKVWELIAELSAYPAGLDVIVDTICHAEDRSGCFVPVSATCLDDVGDDVLINIDLNELRQGFKRYEENGGREGQLTHDQLQKLAKLEDEIFACGIDGGMSTSDAIDNLHKEEKRLGVYDESKPAPRWKKNPTKGNQA